MIKVKKMFLSICSIASFHSCVTSVGKVDYTQYNMTNSKLENVKRLNMNVHSTKRSFFWSSCEDLVQSVLDDLNEQAKAFGGNYIDQIRFSTVDNPSTTTPVCETDWGWAVLYVAPVLGPWVKSASASGNVVFVDKFELEATKKKQSKFASNLNNIQNINMTNECSNMVVGDSEKLVCGDSKDRVLQKWGNPTTVSNSSRKWCYQDCIVEFTEGKLSNYGGKCTLDKIRNDSFNPKESRITLQEKNKEICN